MASKGVNKVTIIGNLGQDPEIRYLSNSNAVANITVATSESWIDKANQQKREETEWHRCVCYGKLAEICGEYLRKGAKIYLEGKLKTRKWQDQQGVDRYTTEIVFDQMQMLDSKPANGASNHPGSYNAASAGASQPANAQPARNATPQGAAQQPAYQDPPMEFDDDYHN